MVRPVPQDRWVADASDRFAALAAWRQAHPTATWAEIEAAVDAELGPLRAQVLGDTAASSATTDLSGERPRCPDCGRRLQAAGSRQRQLQGEDDLPMVLARSYARCPACGTGLSPPPG